MEIGVLGPLQVVDADRQLDAGAYRQRAVLAILVLHVDEVVSLDRLIDLLWGETPPNTATGSLQAYVSNLRRVLEPDRGPRQTASILVTEAPGYRLRLEPDSVDAVRFERLAGEGRKLMQTGSTARAIARFDQALALWRGEALAEFRYEGFAASDVARLDELRAATEEDRIEACLAASDRPDVVAELEGLVARHPLRERLRGLQMLALYRSGRQAEALRAYEDLRRLLADEHGLDPGPQLRALYRQVLEHDVEGDTSETIRRFDATHLDGSEPTVRSSSPFGAESFVGRTRGLALMDSAFDDAAAGRTRVMLVGGEPGIGKSRLAEEVARRAEQRGARSAWGRCQDDVGMPALWPWEQVLRATRTHAGDAASIAELLDPDDLVDPAAADLARFRLYERLRTALAERSGAAPIVVVLDDLHWADPSSLQLLRYLAVELTTARVLVVATFHEPGSHTEGALHDALGDLVRHARVSRLTLEPLTVDDVAELVRGGTSSATDGIDEVARELHRRTDGNAFFVIELLRLLASERALGHAGIPELPADVPLVVGDVIRRRLLRLPDDVQAMLMVAAVIGREFELDLLHRVVGLALEDTFEILEVAVVTGTAVETGPGRYRFGHGLVHETLYNDLTVGRRTQLHRRVAEVIEATPVSTIDERVSRLAHHFAAAGSADGAARYAELAAQQSERNLAYDAAAEQWQTALEWLGDAHDEDGHAARARRLLRLGAAHLAAGNATAAEGAHNRALDAAEASGDVALIAEAALAFGEVGLWQSRPYGFVDERVVAAISRALDMEPAEALRARLLVALAIALYYQEDERARGLQMVREGAAGARQIGDADLLATALVELVVMLDALPERDEQLRIVDELETLLESELAFPLAATARMRIARVRLADGDATSLGALIGVAAREAAEKRQAVYEMWCTWARAGLAFLRGSLPEAEQLAGAAFASHSGLGIWGAPESYALHATLIWREQDRLGEMAPLVEPLLREAQHPGAQKLLAYFVYERGAVEEIAALLGPRPVPQVRDFTWLPEMCATAELCAVSGHSGASDVYRELAPFEGVVATLDGVYVCFGAVAHYLGMLAVAIDQPAVAVRHFEAAIVLNDRIGAVPWSVRSRIELAGVSGQPPDETDRLLDEARRLADRHQLVAVLRRLQEGKR